MGLEESVDDGDELLVRRAPRWPLAFGALLLAGTAVLVGVAVTRDDDGADDPLRPSMARRVALPATGVFARGGVPDGADPALATALGERLPDFAIALDRWSRAVHAADQREVVAAAAAIDEAQTALLTPELVTALGEPAADKLAELLGRARDAAVVSDADADARATRYLTAIGAFNDALALAGHPFYLDGDVMEEGGGDRGRRIVIVYAFALAHVSLYRAGDRPVRALQLRRLDRLNWRHTLLGFTSPHHRDAIVLLDQVDQLLVSYVLPALAPNAEVELFDDASADPEAAWQRDVRARAGELIRTEYAGTRIDGPVAARLGVLLGQRRALFERWQRALEPRGVALIEPRALRLPELDRYAQLLQGVATPDELAELVAIEGELSGERTERVFAAVRDVIIASVERHEVQHRLDGERNDRPIPQPLHRYVGDDPTAVGAGLARDELSAYLAELARDELTPRVGLTLVVRFLFDRDRWATPECYAALAIVDGLATELGIVLPGDLVADGEVKREVVAHAYLAITARHPAELRAAARALWERVFRAPLPEISLIP